jgi:hypothetical protein
VIYFTGACHVCCSSKTSSLLTHVKLALYLVISMNAVARPAMLSVRVKCVKCYLCVSRIIELLV